MKWTILLTLVIGCLPFSVEAQERNRLETWYTNWGIGYPVIQYPDEIADVLDVLEVLGVDNVSVLLDLLGFYWPLSEQTIIGGNLNAWGDRYSSGGSDFQINAYIFGLSAMHFLQDRIGQGVFLRADLGPSRLVTNGSSSPTLSSEWGVGVLVGGGYGIPVSRETRILIHLNYSLRRIEGEQFGNVGIAVSGLF